MINKTIFNEKILIAGSIICVISIIAVSFASDHKNSEFLISALAVTGGYLLTVGVQMRVDSVNRACQFLEERRQDSLFGAASDHAWSELLRRYGEDALSETELKSFEDADIRKSIAIVADGYEEMAILIKYGYANEDVLFDYFGNPVVRFFAGYSNQIKSFRKLNLQLQDRSIVTSEYEYIELEWLSDRWKKRYQALSSKCEFSTG